MPPKRRPKGRSRREETATVAPTDADEERSNEESENASDNDSELTPPIPTLTEQQLPPEEPPLLMDVEHLDTLTPEELQRLRDQTAQEAILAEVKREILMNQARIRHAEAPIETQGPTREKRQRTDTISAGRAPSRFKTKDPYTGGSISEYEMFIGRAESWFSRYSTWYNSHPQHKVAEAADNLDQARFLQYASFEKERGGSESVTWEDFKAHLLRIFRDPDALRREAARRYNDAKQRDTQSVYEFAQYLRTQEEQMSIKYSEEQRMVQLQVKVLRSIQDETLKYPEKPTSYEGTIAFLQQVEDAMPERQKARRGKGKTNSLPTRGRTNDSGSKREADPRKQDNRGGSGKPNEDRTPKGDNPKKDIKCFYCGKMGHKEHECRKKKYDEQRAAGESKDSIGDSKN